MGYKVCWTCQGLLIYNETTLSQTNDHLQQCSGNSASGSLLLEHYVCERNNFNSLKQMKKCLSTEVDIILKRKKDLLVMGFSHQFIDLLLSLSTCKIDENNGMANKVRNFRENNVVFQVSPQNCDKTSHITDVTNGPDVSVKDVNAIDILCSNEMLLTQEEKNILASQCVNSQHENMTKLECKLCGYKTCSSKLMLRHLTSHDNGQGFVCTTCNFSTLLRSKWNRHQCRKSEKTLLCESCSETFEKKSLLTHHIATQHKSTKGNPTKLFKCKECPYVGRDMTSLSDHQRKHTGEYLTCDRPDCTFKTPYKRSLQQHLQQKHATEKALICHVCGFQTKHVNSLRNHMKIHGGNKQHKCAQCSFSSYSSTDVILHTQRKHLKVKTFSCSQCSFQTGYAMALKKHLARHEKMQIERTEGKITKRTRKTKEYTCSFCDEVFKTSAKIKNHMDQCNQFAIQDTTKMDHNVYEEFEKSGMYFDSQLDVDVSAEVYSITSSMMNVDDRRKNTFTTIVEEPLTSSHLGQERYGKKETDGVTCKWRNPMLAETTRTLAAERESPLLEESLFNLMSDFPPPPNLNRCQSASTLMFASLSPHLVDRPLTPDIFSENPASSFFQSLSRNLDQDNLTVSSLNQSFSTPLSF